MVEWVLVGAAGVVLLQLLLGIYVHVDANRRSIENPVLYFYGVSVPLVGLLIAGVYFSRREELPTQDLSVPPVAETEGAVTWSIEHSGLRRLPRRLAYAIQLGRTFWTVGVAAPPALLVLTALVHPAVAVVLSMVCFLYWVTYLGVAGGFTDTTVRLDSAEESVQITSRGSNHPLSTGGFEHEIDLTDVEQADLRRVGTQPLLKCKYENPLSSNPWLVPVAPAHVDTVRETLAAREIPLRDHTREGTNSSIVRQRTTATILSLVAVPLIAGFLWPSEFITDPVFLLVAFGFLWLVLKPFE